MWPFKRKAAPAPDEPVAVAFGDATPVLGVTSATRQKIDGMERALAALRAEIAAHRDGGRDPTESEAVQAARISAKEGEADRLEKRLEHVKAEMAARR